MYQNTTWHSRLGVLVAMLTGMGKTVTSESGARSRTRRAILTAAASVLARNRAATLADIADAADVGRSTLHRYFADRDELVAVVVADSLAAIADAITWAAPGEGSPLDAMHRLVTAMVGAGDRLVFLYGDPRVLKDAEPPGTSTSTSQHVLALIRRGQQAGVFDPEVEAEWIQHVLWALIYTGCEAASQGMLPRHRVTSTVTHTLLNGIRAGRPPAPSLTR